jgi:AcrR family transcriptional regulator
MIGLHGAPDAMSVHRQTRGPRALRKSTLKSEISEAPTGHRGRGRPSQFDDRRLDVLAAAADTINEDGLTNASLEIVASKLSLNKTSLYYYFKNKEELVYKCYQRACEIGRGHAEQAVNSAGDGRAKLEKYIALQLDDNGPMVTFVSDVTLLSDPHKVEILRLAREHDAFVRAILDEGATDGSLRPTNSHLTSLGIIGVLNWTLVWWRPSRGPLTANQLGQAYTDLFLHGIRPAGPAALDWPAPVMISTAAPETQDVFSRSFQAGLRREALFKAASLFFNQNGYDNSNLDKIVDHLGVSKGALYHYVSSKEELLYGCYSRSLDLIEQVLQTIEREPGDGVARFARYIGSMIALHAGPLGPLANFARLKSLTPEHQDEVHRRSQALQRFGADILRLGIADGSIRPLDVRIARLALISAINWVPKWYSPSGRHSPAEISAAFSDLFVNGLIPRDQGLSRIET